MASPALARSLFDFWQNTRAGIATAATILRGTISSATGPLSMGSSLDSVLGRLRKVAAVQALGGLSDRELVERFVGSHDESAFTVLIERHGPMVLGVCRRALPNRHDAEDACQATFLVLARKAGSLRKRASLGSWLHGVAGRVAASLRRNAARRKSRERRADAPAPAGPAAEVTWREVQAILDEELERLPERYRAPLILCYLECLTRDEAARRLGVSPGGLHGQLERGRDLLRERLTKRGLTLSAVLAGAALGEGVAHALPPTFVVSSAKAAALLAAGQPLTEVVGANALALTREVLKSMSLAKVKLGTAAVLCAALLALAGGSFASLGLAQDAKPKPSAAVSKLESDEDFIRRISKDLRGTVPTPTEVHFFASSKDAGRRQKLIDLFILERQAQKGEERKRKADPQVILKQTMAFSPDFKQMEIDVGGSKIRFNLQQVDDNWLPKKLTPRLETLQKEFYKDLRTANGKADVAKATQTYLNRLSGFVKAHPDSPDIPDAIRQIVMVYASQDNTVEADAWRAKLPKEAPKGRSERGKGR